VQKMYLVGLREFSQRVRKRGFLLTAVGLPLILLVVWGITGVFDTTAEPPLQDLSGARAPDRSIGYVDQADFVRSVPDPIPKDTFRAYPGIEAADQALSRGEISAYYVIPPDYRETGQVQRVSHVIPTAPIDNPLMEWLLVANLFPDRDANEVALLRWPFNDTGPEFVTLSPEGAAQSQGNPFLPFLVTIVVMIPLFTSGGYLLQSLTQEKSNRVMEILLVSLRPRQLLGGKLLGLGALTLVQYVVWVVLGVAALAVTGQATSQLLSGISLTGGELLLVVLYALGGFILYAALMAGVGALAPNLENSRSWVFVIGLPMLIPIYLWPSIVESPNGPLANALSIFPFSAPVTMLMRMTSTAVPTWQIGASLALLLVSGVGTVLLISRLFRVQTLLSGESLSIQRVWSALTG
jgi:ABC-2 type transport system permease protein